MLGSTRQLRVYVYGKPASMRMGFDGLYATVLEGLGRSPLSGDFFLFISRDLKRAKALYWDGTGLCMFYKRLEQGSFAPLWRLSDDRRCLTVSELQLFFEGSRQVGRLELSPREYHPPFTPVPQPSSHQESLVE